MSIRGIVKQRIKDLGVINAQAKLDEDKQVYLDSLIRIDEGYFYLKELNKKR